MSYLQKQEVKRSGMVEQKTSFAVVIPVYNGAAHILDALNSCLSQTLLPDEIIVIDDASTDETAQLVKNRSSGLVQYHCNSENRGPSFSRNQGIQLVKSDWILFLDADDVFHPEKIEVIHKCITGNRSIRAIGHSFSLGGFENGKIEPADIPAAKKISVHEALLKNPVVTPALCVCAKNKVLFNERMRYAEDHDFIIRTAEAFGLWFIDIPLCSLERRPLTAGGQSSNKWKMRKGEMKMYINYCKRHNRYPAVPFLLLFSLLKHAKQMMFTQKTASL